MLNASSAQREYYNRPKDERFATVQALIDDAVSDKLHSVERTYTLKDLHVQPTDTGDLQLISPKGGAAMSHYAFGQLCRTLQAPAGFMRDQLSPELAAAVLNHRIKESIDGQDLQLLVRGANGRPPLIRAATSETYGRVWDADLYRAIDRQVLQPGSSAGTPWILPPTWTGDPGGAYRGPQSSFLIVVNGGSIVSDPSLRSAPGTDSDAMYRAIMIRNSEVGAAAIAIQLAYIRFICGNHLLWGAVMDQSFTRRHVGSENAFRDTLREISRVAVKWATASPARDQAIVNGLISHEIASTREGVISQLRAIGLTAEQSAAAYDRTVQTEPQISPRSFWGIAQGITRISQDSGYQDDRYQLDKIAGQLLARGAKLVAA